MSQTKWGKFFWSDWEADEALRLCSLAAQGLWMRMLCLAAKANPVGYVVVSGNPCTVADLSRLTGEREETVGTLLDELGRNGVFSKTRTGTIYSRRMVRDAQKARTNSENGEKGGRVTHEKKTGIFQSPRSAPRDPPSPRSQKPEAIIQKDKIQSGGIPDLRASRVLRPDTDDPVVRKQVWEQKVQEFMRDHWPEQRASRAIRLYLEGNPEGKREYETANREMRQRQQ